MGSPTPALYGSCMDAPTHLAELVNLAVDMRGKASAQVPDEANTDLSTIGSWRTAKQAMRLVFVEDFCAATAADYPTLQDAASAVEK